MSVRQRDERCCALDQILRCHNNAGFVIIEMHCNGERCGVNKVKDDLDVKMNLTNAQDHMAEAEWNNWTIKERITLVTGKWGTGVFHGVQCRPMPQHPHT